MIELLIALFAVLLLSVGFFIKLKGSTVFVLNRESISSDQASRNQRLFQRSGLFYILLGLLCFVAIFLRTPFLYALLLVLATVFTAFFSLRLAAVLKEQSK
ncbi:hypothetical protein [Trichococcus sp.]|uniref:hypothetical protein n=1 Tax=Trichococcus sp. TaxID=1985464 RepID=UPI003C7C6912